MPAIGRDWSIRHLSRCRLGTAIGVRRRASALAALALALAGVAACSPGGGEAGRSPAVDPAPADPLAARGHHVTAGAAPGYVADELCASCHADVSESFREVGMARAFYRPRPDNLIEDLDSGGFFHAASRRHYRMEQQGDRLVMKRHQLDAAGRPIHRIEQEVDWILGSGNHSRTYLFQNPEGELFMLPIAWYTQPGSWDMAPGFEGSRHLGLGRQVRRECMFCHNAYPEVPAGSDAHHRPHRFPAELPEGIGCQRCHGPGAAHSRAAMREPVDIARLHETIVNPGALSPRLRDDVCYGCHMQPSVAIPGKRRFGRADYSFRPGEPLPDYLIQIDLSGPGEELAERFEINHHPYRLEQSRCYQASGGELSCLTCHDPHRKVPPADRATHYRAACLRCHVVDDCQLEEMGAAAGGAVDPGDCAGCHMARRRTQDVVRVVMTDHKIRRRPGGPELLAPVEHRDPRVDRLWAIDPRAPGGELGDLYKAYTLVEFWGGRHAGSVGLLERLLKQTRPGPLEPYLAMAQGLLQQRRPDEAERVLEAILDRDPDYPTARELLGLVRLRLGQDEEALTLLLDAVARGQDRPEARYNLGVVLSRLGRPAEALPHLERAVEMRPNMTVAWFYLGQTWEELGRPAAAGRGYRRALALEPTLSRGYLALAELLDAQGRHDEALRYLRHGVEHAAEPAGLVEALAAAERRAAAAPADDAGTLAAAAPPAGWPRPAGEATPGRGTRAGAASRR